jgi:hypothetical protein
MITKDMVLDRLKAIDNNLTGVKTNFDKCVQRCEELKKAFTEMHGARAALIDLLTTLEETEDGDTTEAKESDETQSNKEE